MITIAENQAKNARWFQAVIALANDYERLAIGRIVLPLAVT